MFNVGDRVICTVLHGTFFEERLGQVATVEGFAFDGENLKLSKPFNKTSSYKANCFELYNPDLENK